MPAPKMKLNDITINQPPYGYTSEIYTGIKWDLVGDNYHGYNNNGKYFKSSIPGVMLDESMQELFSPEYDSNINMELLADHGFYPFSPLFQNNIYNVRTLIHTPSGVLQSPCKHIENKFELLYNGLIPNYSNAVTPNEGNVTLFDGTIDIVEGQYVYEKLIENIREISAPPELSFTEYHNTVICQTGLPQTIVFKRPALINAGTTSDIEISGSLSKIAQIISFILASGTDDIYIGCPMLWYSTVEPSADTEDPEYWLFGRKIPMSKCTFTGHWAYAWKVKCISNPIEVTHNFLNNFSIKLRLALVI